MNDLNSSSEHKMWLWESKWAPSWALLLSLQKYKWMGIRPVIASTPKKEKIWKVPIIQMAALLYILLSSLRGYDSGALL